MLPDACSKHVFACMMSVCTCLVSCLLHRRLFWIAETNYNSIGIYSQNITSSSGPTRVPVRGLRRPVSLVYDEDHGNLFWVDMAAIK